MKAVIMAGGEGSRLRPLTCTLPKPMAKILGKPVIEYIFDLLISGGVTTAAVTLGYLPHIIEEHYESGYKNLKLEFVREDEPLGTAGGVKKAASGFDEPFVVISGDALCDIDISKIMKYHKASGAKITIVAADATDPREYGIVKVDKENRVVGFVEKPSWNQAVSNLANTGIYIVNPECLKLIPKDKKFDFASDLFPLMLENDMPIYCYHTDEYWCDIGDIEAYLKCQRDIFDGKINVLAGAAASGVYVKGALPEGDFDIVPPVYIGENTEISDGAVIGPYAVIDDNCFVGTNAKVRYSTVLENSCISSDSAITRALVCSGAALKSRSAMFENSVAGSGCVIGENAAVKSGVRIWPGKIVGNGVSVGSDVKYGNIRAKCLCENGIDEKCGARLNAETCVRLGASVSNSANGHKVGVANDGSKHAHIMQLALSAGLAGSGSSVWNFGECFEAQLRFLVNICGLDCGLFAAGKKEKSVSLCSQGGLSVPRRLEREIERGMSSNGFREVSETQLREISDMSSVRQLYTQELMKQAPYGLHGVLACIECEDERIKNLLSSCVSSLGAYEDKRLVLKIDEKGATVTAVTQSGETEHEKLLAVCCLSELRNGRNIAIPYDAPEYLDSLAKEYGRKSYRYLSSPADNSDSAARKLAAKQVFVRDGLFLAVKLLSIMKERGCSLDRLVSELPKKFILKRSVHIDFLPSYLSRVTGEENVRNKNDYEGIRIIRDSGKILIIPETGGENVRILAEADSMEAADELCAEMEERINAASEKTDPAYKY